MKKRTIPGILSLMAVLQLLNACSAERLDKTEKIIDKGHMHTKSNPVIYFEIPVTDLDRASKFYGAVFDLDFVKETIDGNETAMFPFFEGQPGISGALAKGEIYKPTNDGVVIYFTTKNIDKTLKSATSNGGKILYPKTDNGIGLVAEFEDTEGNRVALFQSKE